PGSGITGAGVSACNGARGPHSSSQASRQNRFILLFSASILATMWRAGCRTSGAAQRSNALIGQNLFQDAKGMTAESGKTAPSGLLEQLHAVLPEASLAAT